MAELAGLKADHHAWFMQAYEAQFLDLNDSTQVDFDELVASRMNVITTAHWLQQHILRHYAFDSKQTFCVISGLDKTIWKPMPREPLRAHRRVRFLVEGPVNDPRKNADNRGGVTSLLRTHFFRQTGQFSMVFTASDVCGASPNQQALRTFCLLRASFPPPSF